MTALTPAANLENKDDGIHRTPQSFVHIKHNITLAQYKYWHLFLKSCREIIEAGGKPDEDGFYFLNIQSLINKLGYKPNHRALLKDLESLRIEPITINSLEKNGESMLHGMGFISEFKLSSGKIGFRLPSFVEKVIRGDHAANDLFLLLNWNIFNSFGGKYEAVIYKLCKDYASDGQTPYFDLQAYRDYIGVAPNEYQDTRNFTRRCIHEPLKVINASKISDVDVEVKFDYQGKKLIGLQFIVSLREQPPEMIFDELKPHPAFSEAKTPINPVKQIEYLSKYTSDEVQSIIQRANEYMNHLDSEKKEYNIASIYHSAFKEGWDKDRIQRERAAAAEQAEKDAKKAQAKKKKEERKQRQLQQQQYDQAVLDEALRIFMGLYQSEQDEIFEIAANKYPLMYHKFAKNKKENPFYFKEVPLCYAIKNEIAQRYSIEVNFAPTQKPLKD
ncbi:replication initiation protein [Moraxella bovoculi]|uniref:replication initiation protein n=1 Tax=Moraxella bovoculi TaxID=386891 RepID=UPI0009BBCC50|nr:replication initiation protein [Moraxella bovoculi]